MKFAIFVFVAALVAVASAGSVLELTPENFDAYVGGPKAVLVKFFAPWCGHCKHLAPEYEKAAETFANSAKVVLAEVNCDVHKDLCGRFEVHGFPTVKFFKANTKTGIPYEGERTAAAIVKFVEEQGARKSSTLRSAVVSLTPATFDAIVNDPTKDVLVKFFAPWCGHCKKLAPEYEKVSAIYARDNNKVVIAEIDCDAHKDKCQEFGVSGYPTLKYFAAKDKTPVDYNGGRTVKDMVVYINNRAGLKRLETGRLGENAGRVPELDAIAGKFIAATDKSGLLADAKAIAGKADAPASAKNYVKTMESVIAQGEKFVENEKTRLAGLLDGSSLAESKIDDFTVRLNILAAF